MATIELNIYSKKDKKKIAKTYTAEGYDLMLGTIEDFIEIIDLDKLDDNVALTKMVVKAYGQLKPLLKDIFPELTDDEFKRIKVQDLVMTIIQVGHSIMEDLSVLNSGKNR